MIPSEKTADSLVAIALKAGEAILQVYARDFDVDYKGDNSPLTEADRRAHNITADGLGDLPGAVPVLSEEGNMPTLAERRGWEYYWLIDPLDGTKEFVRKNGEFTVNIALMRRIPGSDVWEPVFGLVYAPVLDDLYIGWQAGAVSVGGEPAGKPRAYLVSGLKAGADDWRAAATVISARASMPPKSEALKVVASRSHLNEETENYINSLENLHGTVESSNFGSSLKLCKIASGQAHVYPRYAPTMEWDTAAADAVCRAAGAMVLNAETARPLEYNKENLLNPRFLVTGIGELKELL